MVYVKQTWNNNDPATPLSAERLRVIEEALRINSNVTASQLGLEEVANYPGYFKIAGDK
jgi:hypothetical protein